MTDPKRPRETDLYPPIKAFLEAQGFEVKAEVGAADVVALHPDAPDDDPIIVELKLGFTLTVLHQAIARQAVSDAVYIAIKHTAGRTAQAQLRANMTLCRRLGLGLLTVRLADGLVTAHVDPGPYRPRQSKPRKTRLLREFTRRVGDPNTGGATRTGLVTAYRQDSLRIARHLAENGPTKAAIVARETGVATARRVMADDHYGWFERVGTGIYQLTPKGRAALDEWASALPPEPVPTT